MHISTEREIARATAFVARLKALDSSERRRINLPPDLHGDSYTRLVQSVQDAMVYGGKGPKESMQAFAAQASAHIDEMGFDDDFAYVAQTAVRAVLVRDNPLLGAEHSAKEIYAPFEAVIPYASLTIVS